MAPAASRRRLGVKGFSVFQMAVAKTRLLIAEEYGCSDLFDSGALLTLLKADAPDDEWELSRDHVYWNAHADKANIPAYDFSALLYLSTWGNDFEGGELVFLGRSGADGGEGHQVIQPRAGRLVTFSSGSENLHRVNKVTRGQRLVLAMWFTCSAEHELRLKDD